MEDHQRGYNKSKMLAKIAPRFVISGVIQNAYYANYMAIDLTKQIIGDCAADYFEHDPKHYYECNFFGYLSTLARPTEFISQYEAEKYDEAVKKFAVYNEVRNIFNQLNEFTVEIKELYRVIEANNTSSNFFSRGFESDETWEEDVDNSLTKYHALLDSLEPYPEWRDKVVEDVGKWFHMIHNNLAEGDTKRNIFSKLNRQDYFV